MAEKKSGSKTGGKTSTKTPKRPKNYEPGFFSDYGGCGITVINSPNSTKKNKKK